MKSSDYGRFLRVLASHIAEELQITKIAAQTGVAVQTANAWLAAAQAAGIIYLLPAFTGIAGRQLVKKPKLFFTDTGFAAWLTRVQSAGDLAQFFNRRAFFENFVVMEIRKSWVHNGRRADFSFYRDSRNNCINLIIRDGQTVHPVNIDLTENPRRQQVKSFECLRESGFTVGAGALVCLTEKRWFLTDAAVAHAVHEI